MIVCEGEKTEPNYFKAFRITSVKVQVIGTGKNTENLVEYTNKFVKRSGIDFEQIWCVFDKDDFKKENFYKAIELAKKYNYKIAYSNEAFELWYLLHFNYYSSAISRKGYIKKLENLLNKKYEKNDHEMYDVLINKQNEAIKNAKQLLSFHGKKHPYNSNPSTTVFKLVKELNKYI